MVVATTVSILNIVAYFRDQEKSAGATRSSSSSSSFSAARVQLISPRQSLGFFSLMPGGEMFHNTSGLHNGQGVC